MARKGKKKKEAKRTKKNYNKTEFQSIFCQTCLICPKTCGFCYDGLYRHEPDPFIRDVFNNLIDTHAAYQAMGRSMKSLTVEQFQNTVCRTGVCFDGDGYASATCDNIKICYQDIMRQIGVEFPKMLHETSLTDLIGFKNNKNNKRYISYGGKKNKKAKRKARYVCASYPTFFSRDDTEFQLEMRRILYGDNNLKQNTDKELSGDTAGTTDRYTKGGQP